MIRTIMMSAALLAIGLTGRASAQAAVDDPGYCAQYYPNANCENYGPGNPFYPGAYPAPTVRPGGYAATPPVRAHRQRRRHHHD